MTLLSRKADYALLILTYLSQHPTGGNAREIAEEYGLSRPFVANILKELCHNNYVSSHRGVKGGYVLLPTTAKVNLGEVLEAIGEGFRLTVCSDPKTPEEECCLQASCPVKNPLTAIHRRIVEVLKQMTLQDLFDASDKPVDEIITLTARSREGSEGVNREATGREPTSCEATSCNRAGCDAATSQPKLPDVDTEHQKHVDVGTDCLTPTE